MNLMYLKRSQRKLIQYGRNYLLRICQKMMRKAYLDTNVVSSYIRKDIQNKWEMQAVERIISFWEQGYLECYTSDDVKKELEKIPKKYIDQIDKSAIIWTLLDKAQDFAEKTSRTGWGNVLWGEATWGGGVEDVNPVFAKLSSIFPDSADQRHIFLAIQNKIPFFVTSDKKTILNKVKGHESELQQLGITILSPLEFDNLL